MTAGREEEQRALLSVNSLFHMLPFLQFEAHPYLLEISWRKITVDIR